MQVFASEARTASANSDAVSTFTAPGGVFFLNISAASGTSPTLDVKIQHKDPISGEFVDVPGASFAQKTATGTDSLTIYPGVAETANRSVSDILGDEVRAVATIGGTTPSFTFSLSFDKVE